MGIFLLIILLIIFFNTKFENNKDFLSLKQTTTINGIFIIFVFIRHIFQYVSYNNAIDIPLVLLDKYTGQLIVTTFLFYSGYGIMESIKNKRNYVDSIPKKRIVNTLIRFDICVCLYFVLGLILSDNISLSKFFLSLICVESIGNSNWYILTILCMWVSVFISFKIFKNSSKKALIFTYLLSFFSIFIMYITNRPDYYYNTIICFPLGMSFSFHYKFILKKLSSVRKYIFFIFVIFLLLSVTLIYILKNPDNFVVYEIMSGTFVIELVLLTRYIKINSKVLYHLGKNLFPIYILQRIPMILFKKINLAGYNVYLYFILCILITFILSSLFNKLMKKTKF